ncbi:high-potential iron-sulfur protein [Novosphingobium sp. G106]|uniref:high-potential iron-sulfur protein n=1 Tax=Novosphingobium sp. G106 TaxID=2849500 RepID=UPI001C2DACCC|nr:high-potential iron-sulfur protein [Novosphingobium sp. G106]
MESDRRRFLAFAGLSPLVLLGAGNALAQSAPCYSPEALTFSQKSRRRSLGFMDVAVDPKRRCGGCNFFTAGEGGCGNCQMLGGAPVTANSSCSSFAPRS